MPHRALQRGPAFGQVLVGRTDTALPTVPFPRDGNEGSAPSLLPRTDLTRAQAWRPEPATRLRPHQRLGSSDHDPRTLFGGP